jgi:hypothetical protein
MTGPYVESIRSVAWAGIGETSIIDLLAEHRTWANAVFPSLLEWYDSNIKNSIAYFDGLFKD